MPDDRKRPHRRVALPSRRGSRLAATALAVVLALGAASCSGSDGSDGKEATTTTRSSTEPGTPTTLPPEGSSPKVWARAAKPVLADLSLMQDSLEESVSAGEVKDPAAVARCKAISLKVEAANALFLRAPTDELVESARSVTAAYLAFAQQCVEAKGYSPDDVAIAANQSAEAMDALDAYVSKHA